MFHSGTLTLSVIVFGLLGLAVFAGQPVPASSDTGPDNRIARQAAGGQAPVLDVVALKPETAR